MRSAVTFHFRSGAKATVRWFQWTTGHAKPILLAFALSVPFIVYGTLGALESTSNDPRQWLPRSFTETDTYDWFQDIFGTDEVAVVSWNGCTLTDPRVETLASALEESPFYDRVLTGPRVLQQLVADPLKVPPQVALQRLQGVLIGENQQTTCLVLVTSEEARAHRSEAVAAIYECASSASQLDAASLYLGGPTIDAAAIDAESRHLLFQFTCLSALISFGVAALRLKSVRLAGIVLLSAGYSTGAALAMLYYSGGRMNLLMTMLPPLVYVLTISAGVHLANYHRDAVRRSSPKHAAAHAAARGWAPCSVAALTTSAGLISLATSRIDPIREFGIYSAASVMASLAALFLFLPSALHVLSPHRESARTLPSRRLQELGNRFLGFVQARHAWIVASSLAFLGLAGFGLSGIQSTVKLQARFLPNSPVLADYRWLEKNVGPMVPLEVVIHFDKESSLDLLQRLQLLERVQSEIRSLPKVATLSAADFVRPIPKGSGITQVIQRSLMNRELPAGLASLADAHYLAEGEQEQLWRISVRANAISDTDYGELTETLRQRVDPLLSDARATYTGVIPLIYKAQRQLLRDLVISFVTAFAVIALVLMVTLKSVPAALLAMVPNLFPAVSVFGAMGWLQIPIQIGSVMTASAALGIAVDDTIHFLTWFRRGLNCGLRRSLAIRQAFERCAGAMIHTTVICCSGLAVFVLSTFVPILHFAWLMIFLLAAALVGDLVVLPALLAGPLGRLFRRTHAS